MFEDKPGLTQDPTVYAKRHARLVAQSLPAARAIMLVDPTGFRVCSESAEDNYYIDPAKQIDIERAWYQFRELAALISRIGLPTVVFPGLEGFEDGVFSNNVFATTAKRLIIGSMRHPVRRQESRRTDVRSLFRDGFGYEVVDLSHGPVAELTGVLAIDRPRGAAVCGLSNRVELAALPDLRAAFGLHDVLVTPLVEGEYHLNIVLAIHAGRAAVVWDRGFQDPRVPQMLETMYEGRVLHLTDEEKNAFAGNCIALTQRDLLMSATGVASLSATALERIASWGFRLHPVDVTEFEKGGGSLRCLLTEIY